VQLDLGVAAPGLAEIGIATAHRDDLVEAECTARDARHLPVVQHRQGVDKSIGVARLAQRDLGGSESVVVSRETCGRISEQLGLTDFLIVGKGLAVNRPVPPSVLSDLFESLVAAIYLDGGLDAVRPLVERMLAPEIEKVASGELGSNHKSLLQQWAQRDYGITPTYEVVEETGPDHSKSFRISAQIGGRRYAPAWGRNKKEAEQRAASNALAELLASRPAQ